MTETGTRTGIPLRLVGEDGNAFAILGRAAQALRRNGKAELVKGFTDEATAGDYDDLLQTCMAWFDVDVEEDADEDYDFDEPGGYNWQPCPCECNNGGFCGGCGHAGCGGRRKDK